MRGPDSTDRRRFLATAAGGSLTGLAGCSVPSLDGDGGDDGGGGDAGDLEFPGLATFRGSGAILRGRPAPGGTSIEELPDLSGALNLYIGGGEGGIYFRFVEMLQEIYPEFTVFPNSSPSSSLAQSIVEANRAGAPQADVFWSIDASSLSHVAANDAYDPLSAAAVDPVDDDFLGDDRSWVGVAGRARSVPYNTELLDEADVPDAVADFPGTDALQPMGWAPTYGAFKSFVTAMRLLRGDDATRSWLASMDAAGTERYPNEYVVSQQVADGALTAGFANHYYAMRVKNQRPDAPIDLAFTSGDAGALVNVAGALKIAGTEKGELVDTFVRHLLSAEAQEFFATVSFAYPMIEGVEPVGGLPPVEELSPPEVDLGALSELGPTLEVMREAGVPG